ncbi:hypothetical protein FRC02_001848 [Tulasnella sp. 418]|nr:hypothetical protein FRC02_001848 [Tulasnella sp. 418]
MEASNDAAISSPIEGSSNVDPSTTTEITAALTSPPLSKSAQKRMLKEARRQEHKLEKRARERELKKEKKRIRAEKRAAGEELVEDENPRKKQRTGKKKPFKARVVVDLGFDDKMQPKVGRNTSHPSFSAYSSLFRKYTRCARSSTIPTHVIAGPSFLLNHFSLHR